MHSEAAGRHHELMCPATRARRSPSRREHSQSPRPEREKWEDAHTRSPCEQQAVEQFTASVPLMQNEVSEAEGTAQFDAERLETTWQWVARAQNLPSDSLDPKQVIANGFVE